MKHIKLTTGEYLLVEVPEDAKNFTIIESHSYFKSPRVEHSVGGVNLPTDGQWKIIGRASEIKEHGWQSLIEMNVVVHDNGHTWDEFYRDYNNPSQIVVSEYSLQTATESGLSLIKSHSMNPSTTLLIKKK